MIQPWQGDPRWDDLVDRLAVYDVRYLTGGSAWDARPSPYSVPGDVDIQALILDLAQAPAARLRNALVALFFRRPACAPLALSAGAALGEEDRARLELLTRYLAAAALRRKWRFVLSIYLPGQPTIDAAPVAARLGVPSPEEGYGRPCLHAAAELLRRGQPFPYNYESSWTAAADHILEDVRVQARQEERYGA